MTSRPEHYTVGWICAIPTEYVAACELLDEQYTDVPYIDPQRDSNLYTFGRIHDHNIVVACLPNGRYGLTSAALVAERMRASFPLRFGLLVGIAGGAPSKKHDVRLGDVVVSSPTPRHGGVFQYDYGKELGEYGFQETGHLAPPPDFLLNALSLIKMKHMRHGHKIAQTVKDMLEKNKRLRKQYGRPDSDKLYEGDQLVAREDRDPSEDDPVVHYGLIASANQLMKDAKTRDALVAKHDVLCFEMEAAGVVSFPCLVIRGICDYSDAHKNDEWQGYASATAAAYAKELLEVIPGRQAEPVKIETVANNFDVPFSLDGIPATKKFVGRSDELKEMEEALLSNREARNIFVLCGLGGIGKTQLSVKFMRLHQKRFTAIIWLDGSTEENLKQSMARFMDRLAKNRRTIEDAGAVAELLSWLSLPDNDQWLLVFDNVDRDFEASDNLAYDVRQYFPTADHGSILITTRLAKLQQLGESQQVKEVDERNAFEILRSWYKKAKDDADCQRLLQLLDGLPLAITQAGAYLQQSGMPVKTYLRMYEEKQVEVNKLIQRPDFNLSDYPKRNVWTTWTISYDAVFKTSESAAHLLLFWSCCDRHDLWYGLFVGRSPNPILKRALRVWTGDIAEREVSFFQAMELLQNYSLIESRADGYMMHSVVHRWAYLYLAQHNLVELEILAFLVITESQPDDWARDRWTKLQRIAPHAQVFYDRLFVQQGLKDIESIIGTTNLTKRQLFVALAYLGDIFRDSFKYEEAETILSRALRGMEDLLGDGHWETIFAIISLGLVYDAQERADEAEKMLLRALRGCEKTYGPYHTWTLNCAEWLGSHYLWLGKLGQAETMLSKAVAGNERNQGSKHIETFGALRKLGWLYKWQGKSVEAEETLLRALMTYEKVLGRENEWTLSTFEMLARFYGSQGNFAKAEEYLRLALAGLEAQAGRRDRLMIWIVHQLAEVCVAQGKLAEAKKHFLRALESYEDLLGPTWVVTLFALVQLGLLYAHEEAKDSDKLSNIVSDSAALQTTRISGGVFSSKSAQNNARDLNRRVVQGLESLLGDSEAHTLISLALKEMSDESLTRAYALLKEWHKNSGYPLPSMRIDEASKRHA